MSILNPTSWFASKKLTLDRVKLDDLKREKFKLENDIKLLEKEEEQVNKDRESREDEYRAAHATGKESAKKAIIRKLQTLKIQTQGVESRIKTCYSIYQTTIGLIAVKENQAFYEKLGVGALVMKMDIDELQTFIQNATIEGELRSEKLAQLLGATDILTETDSASEAILISEWDAALLNKPSHHPIKMSADEDLAAAVHRAGAAAEHLNRIMKEKG